jgi:hypothetical protein
MTRRDEEFDFRNMTNGAKKTKRQRRLDELDDQQLRLMAKSDQRRSARQYSPRLPDISEASILAMVERQKPAHTENKTSAFSLRRSDWASLGWQEFTQQRPWYSIDFDQSRFTDGGSTTNAHNASNSATLLPWPRGPLSEYVISTLSARSQVSGLMPPVRVVNPLSDDDFQLALFLCYELHCRGDDSVQWEWDPGLLSFRGELEREFLHALQKPNVGEFPSKNILKELDAVVTRSRGDTVSANLANHADLDKVREYLVHFSIQQLKNADAQSFSVARLSGAARTAMVQMQFGDSGCGVASASTESLFGATMTALQLDPTPGVYAGHVPGVSLAGANLTSFFSLHRRWRGAMVGQVAVTKMMSSATMNECTRALRKLDVEPYALRHFETRSRNDALHSLVARNRLIPSFLDTNASSATDILFGACSQLEIEANFNRYVLQAWSKNYSSLVPWGAPPHGGVPHEGNHFFHGDEAINAMALQDGRS